MILAMSRELVIETVLLLADMVNEENNREWNLLLMEIFYLLFRNQNPKIVSDAGNKEVSKNKPVTPVPGSTRPGATKGLPITSIQQAASKGDVLAMAMLDEGKNKSFHLKNIGSRHSRFGGTIARHNQLGNGGRFVVREQYQLIHC